MYLMLCMLIIDIAMAESCQGQGCGFVEIIGQVDMEHWCVIQ